MQAVAGPFVAAAQCFEDKQRFVEFFAEFHSPLQTVVVAGPPIGDHPVQNVIAVFLQRSLVKRTDS